jgi:hypothetical protein
MGCPGILLTFATNNSLFFRAAKKYTDPKNTQN